MKILPFLVLGAFLMLSSSSKPEPRGYRNKNPGNLKLSNITWDGKIPNAKNTDKVFEQFVSDYYGIRAAALDLYHDITKGADTIQKLITEYAPANENKTNDYIRFVAKKTGINSHKKLTPNTATLVALLKAIFEMENGFNKYGDMQIIAAIDGGVGKRYGIN